MSAELLKQPFAVMQNDGKITDEAGTKLLGAVILKHFLTTLDEISAENYRFSKATPTIE